MEKTFQAAQITHERFLTVDHSWKYFFDICQADLPMLCIVLHIRGSWKFSLAGIKKTKKYILQEWSMVKNISFVSCAAWNVFSINSLPCSQSKGLLGHTGRKKPHTAGVKDLSPSLWHRRLQIFIARGSQLLNANNRKEGVTLGNKEVPPNSTLIKESIKIELWCNKFSPNYGQSQIWIKVNGW